MKFKLFFLLFAYSTVLFSQETNEISEEFNPVIIGANEAFLSTKTGEYVLMPHEDTNPEHLKTTSSGVVYTNSIEHIVIANETLFGIAKKYGLTVSELVKLNKLSSKTLKIGQKLTIIKEQIVKSSSPVISFDGEEQIVVKLRPYQSPWELNSPPPLTKIPESSREAEESNFHIVKRGETLFSIGKKHNLSVQEIKKLNNLVMTDLRVGQKLKLK